jgi:ABC-type multidrug transport system fused ATPase/permease subunit
MPSIKPSRLGKVALALGDGVYTPRLQMSDAVRASAELSKLGSGGQADRLHFRLVVATLVRCVRLLRPVRWHVVGLFAGFALLFAVVVPATLILLDLFWTRALQGQAMTPESAAFFGLDPSVTAGVESLAPEVRRHIARRGIVIAGVVFGAMIPFMIALWYWQVWILQRVNQLLRIELLERLQTLSLRFHSENRVGDAIYRLYQDSAMVTQLIDVLFLTPVTAFTRYAALVAAVAVFDPRLSLALLLVWPPVLVLGAVFSRRLRVGFRAAREANSELTSRIQETLTGIRVIKAYGAELREQSRFEDESRHAFAAAASVRSRLARFNVAIFWVVGTVLLGASGWAAFVTMEGRPLYLGAALAAAGLGTWNLGLYNAFKFVMGSGTDSVRLLFKTWGRTQDIAIGLDRVFELLDIEPEVQDAADAIPLPPIRESVAFRKVGFRYQPDRAAIEDVDFEARVGSITAIVGPTGSGKSTLMALLLRLFDPDRGAIELDGVDIRRYRLEDLRSRIAIALQENILFGTTIRENIRYAVPAASDELVRRAARVACAEEFIEAQPEGFDTLLGEKGTKLSSGQRQRLSIARAVLKDTNILILDEPTASLDAVTESVVLRNLAEWGKDRAIFLITHRLSTIRRADRVVFLRDGRAIESGTHAELMSRSEGAYRSLIELEEAPRVERPDTAASGGGGS